MSAGTEAVDVLKRLLECEEEKRSAIMARQPEKLAEILQIQCRLLGELEAGGHRIRTEQVPAAERTLAALRQACDTNRLLLEELLFEVEFCLSLLEEETGTYAAVDERAREKKSAPAVCDIRA
ncbi:MAG: hypothetical protein GX162_10180 [Firmicutes bacterium]|nr:hypothetical protein [Bacillota bacterium]